MEQPIFLRRRAWPVWTADAVALLGLVIYLIQAVWFAHTTISNLDEGGYLLKGTLFVGGGYRPFDPGIWTNKAPLAFLVPGFVQAVFGAGLRTGRYLAILFGVMAVIGTWVTARRLGGRWLAVGAVFALALSPAVIKMYSTGVTQSTIACLLAWSLALSLGENRPAWQLALAGLLAGLMMLVRQNMLPVLPLLALYAFWQHGVKALWLLLSGTAIVAYVHLIYWPEILQLWYWVPLVQIPAQVTYSGGGTVTYRPEIEIMSRMLSVFQTFRFHFIALMGSIVSILLWPKWTDWRSRDDFRIALFLLTLFWGLVYMHSVAAIGQDYCVFCFTPYVAFFNVAGILLLVVTVKSWNWRPARPLQFILIAVILVVLTAMGLSAFEDIGASLLNLPAPRMRDLRILPGFVTWYDILSNRFDLSTNEARKYMSTVFGLIAAVTLVLAAYVLWRRSRHTTAAPAFAPFYASVVLILGLVLSPLLSGSAGRADCRVDVIKANEQIGIHLKTIIPDNSLVYWDGGLSTAPLLYLPDVRIFPAQINSGYSFLQGGDTAQLIKFGYWNEELATQWKATAEFFIIEEVRYPRWMDFFDPEHFKEYQPTPTGTSCEEETRLRIFRRNP